MCKQQVVGIVAACTLWLLGGVGPEAARADFVVYVVTVDTSAINGVSGNLDFQFDPGEVSALGASATISNFQSNGALASSNQLTGDATGLLPGQLMLDNGTAYNDIYQGFTYGTSFTFDLTLSGVAVGSDPSSGSSFALSLYDATGTIPLLTTDPNSSVLTVNINADGTTSVQTFAQSPTDPTPVARAGPLISAAPAPPSLILAISALPAGLLVWRRRRRSVRLRAVGSP